MIESYNERRDCADQRIAEFIFSCGFLPIPVPNNPQIIEEMVTKISPDGIILTGGNSLVEYGGNAPERDASDKLLIRLAIQKDIPLYGFCRGMQSILSYFESSLEQVTGHVAIKHEVEGDISELVNSYHNQACVKLNEDELLCLARAKDGVIEAIRHKKYPILGTMWHPERENPYNETDKKRVIELFERRKA